MQMYPKRLNTVFSTCLFRKMSLGAIYLPVILVLLAHLFCSSACKRNTRKSGWFNCWILLSLVHITARVSSTQALPTGPFQISSPVEVPTESCLWSMPHTRKPRSVLFGKWAFQRGQHAVDHAVPSRRYTPQTASGPLSISDPLFVCTHFVLRCLANVFCRGWF